MPTRSRSMDGRSSGDRRGIREGDRENSLPQRETGHGRMMLQRELYGGSEATTLRRSHTTSSLPERGRSSSRRAYSETERRAQSAPPALERKRIEYIRQHETQEKPAMSKEPTPDGKRRQTPDTLQPKDADKNNDKNEWDKFMRKQAFTQSITSLEQDLSGDVKGEIEGNPVANPN